MLIIPAIDIKDGFCVRLYKGDFENKKVYDVNPIKVAERFSYYGYKRLHIVDLDGAYQGRMKNLDIILKIRDTVEMELEVGGGIRDKDTIKNLLKSGIDYVIIGSLAYENENLVKELLERYKDKIIIAGDIKDKNLSIKGWQEATDTDILDFVRKYEDFMPTFIITDISKDGTLEGVNDELYKFLLENTVSKIIASGGIGSKEDIDKLSLLSMRYKNLVGCIVGKAFYENKISLDIIGESDG
jgi:phosphoribosylformimino-5-aminoimidazole carboxamide ribotide isomerase